MKVLRIFSPRFGECLRRYQPKYSRLKPPLCALRLVEVLAQLAQLLPRLDQVLRGLVPSPFSIEGGKSEAEGALHTVLGGS